MSQIDTFRRLMRDILGPGWTSMDADTQSAEHAIYILRDDGQRIRQSYLHDLFDTLPHVLEETDSHVIDEIVSASYQEGKEDAEHELEEEKEILEMQLEEANLEIRSLRDQLEAERLNYHVSTRDEE